VTGPGISAVRPALRHFAPALALAIWLVPGSPAAATESPQDWIGRMGYALEYLNYEGTLVQRSGTEATVLKVVHRVADGEVTERITALDEVGREIIREGPNTTCILPDQKSVLVQPGPGEAPGSRSPLRKQFRGQLAVDDSLYRLAGEKGSRVAGRDTHLITIRPLDAHRYGYRLWLDRRTAMPLKVQVTDADGGVVEQLLFSDIKLPEVIPADAVQPSMAMDSFTWRRTGRPAPARQEAGATGWVARTLPPGFTLREAGTRTQEQSGRPIQHLVYSDGVASVSVFVEEEQDAARRAEGASAMGAASAFTVVRGESLVTAVGEVPPATVEAIARAMRPAP
jgi:sigma-E factor negative regulatory protein RseB